MADAHGSGPCARKGVEVQILSSASGAPRGAPVLDSPSPLDGEHSLARRQPLSRCRRLPPAALRHQAIKARRLEVLGARLPQLAAGLGALRRPFVIARLLQRRLPGYY